jgi:hypothetical protein
VREAEESLVYASARSNAASRRAWHRSWARNSFAPLPVTEGLASDVGAAAARVRSFDVPIGIAPKIQEGGGERLLHSVLGLLTRAEQVPAEGAGGRRVALEGDLEGVLAAPLDLVHEAVVAGKGEQPAARLWIGRERLSCCSCEAEALARSNPALGPPRWV